MYSAIYYMFTIVQVDSSVLWLLLLYCFPIVVLHQKTVWASHQPRHRRRIRYARCV